MLTPEEHIAENDPVRVVDAVVESIDYMEFNDSLDNFEVIAKRFACKEHTAANGIAKKSFLPIGRSCFAVARHIIDECYDLERTMGNLANYFDYEAFGRELFMWDYNMGPNGNVFRRS